jgi:signal transduction histidine kinase
MIWSVDLDLTIDFIAGSALERLTFGRDQLVGTALADVYARPGGQAWLEAHQLALAGPGLTVVAPFDGRMWQAQLEPRRGPDGSTTGVLGMVVDVSDLAAARKEAQERLTALERIDDERRRLLLKLTRVARDERHRLSREIHDDLGQLLTSAALYAKALRERAPMVADDVIRLESILADSLRSVRRTVSSLREPEQPLGDLGAAVERLAEAAAVPGVHTSVHVAGVSDPLSTPIATAAYRIVQESLTNALKHASATVVSIVVTQLPTRLTVIVEDDGKGFDAAAEATTTHGHGLTSMRERAREIGGQLTVVSSPGAGTVVRLEVSMP